MKSTPFWHRSMCFALVLTVACFANPCWAGGAATVLEDSRLFVTAPLRWDSADWLYFAGSVAAVGVAHRYDEDVRAHFLAANPSLSTTTQSHSLSDAAPAAAALLGTWAFALATDDRNGYRETWAMAEAAALGTTTSYLLKFAAGRSRPNETSDSNKWRIGGDSFPSGHSTAAFAIGTVLAESGSDEYRWVRRVLGYGLGTATAYQRLKHNQHWLSDTVAGAALGISSAHFAMNRRDARQLQSNIAVTPVEGGLLLTYTMPLN